PHYLRGAVMMAPARAFFREAGCGPAVDCIHSSASSSAQWRPLMDRLAGRFHTLAVDLYGSGKTPAWPGHRWLTLAEEPALLPPAFTWAVGDAISSGTLTGARWPWRRPLPI